MDKPTPYARRIPDSHEIPADLLELPIWLAWRLVQRPGQAKPGKQPVSPITGREKGWGDPANQADFETARDYAEANGCTGLGIAITPGCGLAGGDLDGCRCPDTGELTEAATAILAAAATYTEVSPGLAGIRFIARGSFGGFTGTDNDIHVELYDGVTSKLRFLTITGDYLEQYPFAVEERDLTDVGRQFFPHKGEASDQAKLSGEFHPVDITGLDISDYARKVITTGEYTGDDGSVAIFGIAKDLIRAGLSVDDTARVLADPANGISAVAFRRRGANPAAAMDWLINQVVLKAAREVDEEPPPVDLAFLSKRTTGRWLTPVGELLERPQPLEWLIKGFLLPGSLAMIVGDPEGGKSLLAIWWAACIAILRAWLGYRVKQGPVIYIAGEGHFGIRRRLKAWAIAHDCEDDLKRAPLFVSSSGTRFIDRKALDEVISEIDGVAEEHGPPVLIVIDTLHRNLGGEENSADDMGIFFHHADVIRFRYGCTVLIVHHTGHGDKERGRGTSSIRAALDIEYLLSSNGTTRTLKPTKAKDMPRPAPLLFNLKEIELPWKDADGDHETSVILEAANGSAAMPDTKASANIRLGVETLCTVLDTTGRDEVTLEAWRQEFYARHPGDSHDAKKKAFQRVRTDLVTNHVCDVRDDLYRLADTATQCRWSDIVGMLLTRQITAKPHGK